MDTEEVSKSIEKISFNPTQFQEDETYRNDIINKLMIALGAKFCQYIKEPTGFLSNDKRPILFLPLDFYDILGEKLEREISRRFDVRIKYVSDVSTLFS